MIGTGRANTPTRQLLAMCKYCNWAFHDGWGELLEYDDVYQDVMGGAAETESTHGFHDSWDDLQDELEI
jgi:hypothetical protein